MSETVSTPKGQGNVGESPAVFISWSGRHCGQLAAGLKGLLTEVLGKGWEVWFSADMEIGARWRAEIKQNAEKARAIVVCLTPESLRSRWQSYEAGAFLTQDKTTLPLACGLSQARLRKSPLEDLQLGQASQRKDVKSLVKSIVACSPGAENDDLWQRFDQGWSGFELAVRQCQSGLNWRRWRSPRVLASIGVGALVLAFGAGSRWCELQWKPEDRCDCEWARYVRDPKRDKGEPAFASKLKRRPFALARRMGDSGDPVVLTPSGPLTGTNATVELIFAASEKDQEYASGLAISSGAGASWGRVMNGACSFEKSVETSAPRILRKDSCWKGKEATYLVVGFHTLSDDQFCEKARRLAADLGAPDGDARQVTDLLASALATYKDAVPPERLEEWVEACLPPLNGFGARRRKGA
jgi:hypothetical protein